MILNFLTIVTVYYTKAPIRVVILKEKMFSNSKYCSLLVSYTTTKVLLSLLTGSIFILILYCRATL